MRVLSGAVSQTGPVAQPWPEPVPVAEAGDVAFEVALPAVTSRRSSPVIGAAAESTGTGLVLPFAGGVLAGALLLAVVRIRARGIRAR